MTEPSRVSIDRRALGDLRRIAHTQRLESRRLQKELRVAEESLQKARDQNTELHQQIEQLRIQWGNEIEGRDAQIAAITDDFENGSARLTEINQELTQALRQAQAAYLSATGERDTLRDQLEAMESQLTTTSAELKTVRQRHRSLTAECDELRAQVRRIKESRAWSAVSSYRRAVKWIRR